MLFLRDLSRTKFLFPFFACFLGVTLDLITTKIILLISESKTELYQALASATPFSFKFHVYIENSLFGGLLIEYPIFLGLVLLIYFLRERLPAKTIGSLMLIFVSLLPYIAVLFKLNVLGI